MGIMCSTTTMNNRICIKDYTTQTRQEEDILSVEITPENRERVLQREDMVLVYKKNGHTHFAGTNNAN